MLDTALPPVEPSREVGLRLGVAGRAIMTGDFADINDARIIAVLANVFAGEAVGLGLSGAEGWPVKGQEQTGASSSDRC